MLQDVFGSDAFSSVALTDAVNRMPFVPGRVGAMGLFQEKGITTTDIAIEEKNGILTMVPVKERGAPAHQNEHGKRSLRKLSVPHLPIEDSVRPSEIQNVRAFGGTELQGMQQVINDRLAEMVQKLDVTMEYHRLGAIKGVILDANGSSVIYNLFSEFNVTQTSIDFVLGTTTTNIKAKCLAVKRAIEKELGGQVFDHVHCFAGQEWFDKFVAHPEVVKAYERYQESAFLRQDNRKGFEFAGIFFEEYQGAVGEIDFVADAEAHFFPVGVAGLFKTVFAPGDFMEAANTVGLPRYAKQAAAKYDKGRDLWVESNPLSYCTRPKALVKGTTSN